MRTGVVLMVLAAMLIACGKRRSVVTSDAEADAAVVAFIDAESPDGSYETALVKRVFASTGWREAFDGARPLMNPPLDTRSVDKGAVLFSGWAAEKMRWPDVVVSKDETSFGLARKDIEGARGKRLCRQGRLAQIKKIGTMYSCYLNTFAPGTTTEEMLNLQAVGDTGQLVDGSPARFCGVVTGLYDFDNTRSGVTATVTLVGMFDLPGNRADGGK